MAEWMPMKKAKPEKNGTYWVTEENGKVYLVNFSYGEFPTSCKAWMPAEVPAPYELPMTEAEAVMQLVELASSYHAKTKKALLLAQEALEKRIPIRVFSDKYGDYCPTCKKKLIYKGDFCWHCGQALEWGEEGDSEYGLKQDLPVQNMRMEWLEESGQVEQEQGGEP